MFKLIWIGFCTLAGAGIGYALLGGYLGLAVGAVLGALFGRFITLSDFLLDTWD